MLIDLSKGTVLLKAVASARFSLICKSLPITISKRTWGSQKDPPNRQLTPTFSLYGICASIYA
jgi:hypothetical protein